MKKIVLVLMLLSFYENKYLFACDIYNFDRNDPSCFQCKYLFGNNNGITMYPTKKASFTTIDDHSDGCRRAANTDRTDYYMSNGFTYEGEYYQVYMIKMVIKNFENQCYGYGRDGYPRGDYIGFGYAYTKVYSLLSCDSCTEPSDPTPTPPEDTNTTLWKLVGEKSCSDTNATLPDVCSDTNTSNIVTQTWKTGCCGENTRCYQSVPKCDDNQTLDMNATPPICIDNCTEEDTQFPEVPDNYKPDSNLDAAECLAFPNALQQTRRVSCKDEYRCLVPDHDNICDEPISSYVSPKGQVFHEDIALTGVDFGLHYQSRFVADGVVAKGWGISTYHSLKEGNLQLGSGAYVVPSRSYAENNLTVVVYGSNELLFDANGQLQSTRDLYTKETKTTFSYDNMGRLVTLTDIYGEISTIERDANGTVTAIVAPTGQRTLLSIDNNGDLLEVQYEDSSSYAFEYERHLMTVETEPKGNRFLHFFDEAGKIVKVIDAEQGKWLFGSNTADSYGSHTVTRASGDVIVYKNHFLENNSTLKTEKILPSGDIILYENTVDDSRSSTTSCGMKTTNIYKKNADGTLYKDPYTNRRVLKSTTVTTPSGLSKVISTNKSYRVDDNGVLKNIYMTTRLNGKLSKDKRDFERFKAWHVSSEGKKNTTTFGAKNIQVKSINPYGLYATTYTYDDKGRVTEEKFGYRKTFYTYDARGNLATTTDPSKKVTSYAYDLRDRLTSITYPDGHTMQYAYDSNGNMTTLTTPTPTDHTFGYNGVNKRVSMTSPLQLATTYTYDKQRRVTKVTKSSGKTIDTTYTNGRVTSIQTEEGTTNYSYACQSNISQISKGSESFSFTYDGTLVTSIVQSGLLNQTIAYTYNNDFIPTSVTYAGASTNYLYNKDNELVSSNDFTISRSKHRGLDVRVTDGVYVQESHYNLYGELSRQSDGVVGLKVYRNKNAQIVKKVEKLQNQRRKVYHYTYDERGRLTKSCRVGIPAHQGCETYTYDANGNRATATVNGTTVTASYTLDDNLVVYGDNTYLYDEDGYLKTKTTPQGTTTYTYGTLGELLEVTTPTKTITYRHNANNQRVAKLIDGAVVEKYLWADLTTLLAVYDGNDTLVQRFEYANGRMPVAMTQGSIKYYLHYDQVGSLRAVSDTQMNIVKEITYDTYGNILSDTNSSLKVPFGFAGGLYDSDTKLTRFGYRDYDAYVGKWTAKDPIGFDGGDSNLYGYVLGDPVGLVDPSGLCTFFEKVWSPIDCLNEHIDDIRDPKLKDFFNGVCRKKDISVTDSCTDFAEKISDKCLENPARGLNTAICGKIYIEAYDYCTRNFNAIPICKDNKKVCDAAK